MTHPQITVAIPTLPARRQLLTRAVKSVSRQTLPAAAISIATDVSRAGAAPTRQRALDAVQTEWVAFLDDDDYFKERHLEALYRHAMETDADMVYSWFDMPGGADPFPTTHYTETFERASELAGQPIETTITTLCRTDLAKSVGFAKLDRGEANSGEDYRFTLGLVAAGAKISHLVDRTWYYSVHGEWSPDGKTQLSGNTSGLPTRGDALLWTP